MWFFKPKTLETKVQTPKIDVKSTKKEIGDILKKARESFKIDLSELSKTTSVKEQDLKELENGSLLSGKLALKDIEKIIECYPLSYNQKKFILTSVDNIMLSVGSSHTDERVNLKEIIQELDK